MFDMISFDKNEIGRPKLEYNSKAYKERFAQWNPDGTPSALLKNMASESIRSAIEYNKSRKVGFSGIPMSDFLENMFAYLESDLMEETCICHYAKMVDEMAEDDMDDAYELMSYEYQRVWYYSGEMPEYMGEALDAIGYCVIRDVYIEDMYGADMPVAFNPVQGSFGALLVDEAYE